MAIFPGAGVECSVAPRIAGSGTRPADVSLYGWVRPRDLLAVPAEGDRTQLRVAQIPAGETDAGRWYLGVSGQYVETGTTDLTPAQVTAFFNMAAARASEFGGGVDRTNPGWRFVFTTRGTGETIPYVVNFSPTRDFDQIPTLFGLRSHLTPPIYVDTLTAARINFAPYREQSGTTGRERFGSKQIVEHRFTFVDSRGEPYNLPLRDAATTDQDISWQDSALDLTDAGLTASLPWMQGIPGADTVSLGPPSTLARIRMEVQEVAVVPAETTLPDRAFSRRLRVGRTGRRPSEIPAGYNVFETDLPNYLPNGQEIVSGRIILVDSNDSSDLDGDWTVDDTPGFLLLGADRVNLLEYDVVLGRNHPFLERAN